MLGHFLQDPQVTSARRQCQFQGSNPHKAGKHKRPKKKGAKKGSSSTHNKGSNPNVKTGEGLNFSAPASVRPTTRPLGSPGDDTILTNAEHIECEGGLVLFQGTRHHPLIIFETEHQARHQACHQLRLWRVGLIDHECQNLDMLRMVGTFVSPRPSDLPWLPPWAAPNGWDYWGRPWAYLDALSCHSKVGVSSALNPLSTRVTVAVLVDCPHEPQSLPDMAVTQSASVAAGRAMRQNRPLTSNGEIQDNLKLEVAAKWLLPRGYGEGYSAAVLDQLKAWETFCMLGVVW